LYAATHGCFVPGEFSHHGGIGTVAVEDLPEEINKDEVNIQEKELGDLKQILYETEKNLILKAMPYYGSTRKAAQALGVSQPTIVRRLHQYSKEDSV